MKIEFNNGADGVLFPEYIEDRYLYGSDQDGREDRHHIEIMRRWIRSGYATVNGKKVSQRVFDAMLR